MVKVRMLIYRQGIDFANSIGDVVDVDGETAERMMASGQCELVRAAAKPETTKAAPAKKRAAKKKA